jgi:hypothetical protein
MRDDLLDRFDDRGRAIYTRAEVDQLVDSRVVTLDGWPRLRRALQVDSQVVLVVDQSGRLWLDRDVHRQVLARPETTPNDAYRLPGDDPEAGFDPEVDPFRLP